MECNALSVWSRDMNEYNCVCVCVWGGGGGRGEGDKGGFSIADQAARSVQGNTKPGFLYGLNLLGPAQKSKGFVLTGYPVCTENTKPEVP